MHKKERGVRSYNQKALRKIVQESGQKQQPIAAVSEETMKTVLESSMVQSTALQAYIADDMFSDVKADVLTLQEFATELFAHAESFADHPVYEPEAGTVALLDNVKQAVDAFVGDAAQFDNLTMLALFRFHAGPEDEMILEDIEDPEEYEDADGRLFIYGKGGEVVYLNEYGEPLTE